MEHHHHHQYGPPPPQPMYASPYGQPPPPPPMYQQPYGQPVYASPYGQPPPPPAMYPPPYAQPPPPPPRKTGASFAEGWYVRTCPKETAVRAPAVGPLTRPRTVIERQRRKAMRADIRRTERKVATAARPLSLAACRHDQPTVSRFSMPVYSCREGNLTRGD